MKAMLVAAAIMLSAASAYAQTLLGCGPMDITILSQGNVYCIQPLLCTPGGTNLATSCGVLTLAAIGVM